MTIELGSIPPANCTFCGDDYDPAESDAEEKGKYCSQQCQDFDKEIDDTSNEEMNEDIENAEEAGVIDTDLELEEEEE